jgi:hypothetical protein
MRYRSRSAEEDSVGSGKPWKELYHLVANCEDRDLPIRQMKIVSQNRTRHHAWNNDESYSFVKSDCAEDNERHTDCTESA